MTAFLTDLWQDLRQSRLLPVAGVLVLALVALPVLLLKPAEESPPAPAAVPVEKPSIPGGSAITADARGGGSSRLDVFTKKDPFAPQGGAAKAGDPAVAKVVESSKTAIGTATGGSGSGGSSGGSTGGGSGGGGGGEAPAGSIPTEAPASPPPADDGDSKRKQSEPTAEPKARPRFYTFVVDVRFGQADKVKAYDRVQRLDVLPSSIRPVVVFLGTTPGGTAVFLVDGQHAVETTGRCRPSPTVCSLLYLRDHRKDNLARLTAPDGKVYGLRLADVTRITQKQAKAEEKADLSRSRRIRRTRARAGKRRGPVSPRFIAPLFGDLAQ